MQIGKFYRLKEEFTEDFLADQFENYHMLQIMKNNGFGFEVIRSNKPGLTTWIEAVKFNNGKEFSCETSGENYFELSSGEFYAFEEITEEEFKSSKPNTTISISMKEFDGTEASAESLYINPKYDNSFLVKTKDGEIHTVSLGWEQGRGDNYRFYLGSSYCVGDKYIPIDEIELVEAK